LALPVFHAPHVPEAHKELFQRAIANDLHFLQQTQIMDYSLLLGVTEPTTADDGEQRGSSVEAPAPRIQTRIVDIIGAWTLAKSLESSGKRALKSNKDNVTILPPRDYAARFSASMSEPPGEGSGICCTRLTSPCPHQTRTSPARRSGPRAARHSHLLAVSSSPRHCPLSSSHNLDSLSRTHDFSLHLYLYTSLIPSPPARAPRRTLFQILGISLSGILHRRAPPDAWALALLHMLRSTSSMPSLPFAALLPKRLTLQPSTLRATAARPRLPAWMRARWLNCVPHGCATPPPAVGVYVMYSLTRRNCESVRLAGTCEHAGRGASECVNTHFVDVISSSELAGSIMTTSLTNVSSGPPSSYSRVRPCQLP
jgi:hypothetical protein